MGDVFWDRSTQVANPSLYSEAYLASIVKGAAMNGSQDLFQQVSVADMMLATQAGITSDNVIDAIGFTPVQQGTGAGQASNQIKVGWDGTSHLLMSVDSSALGSLPYWGGDAAGPNAIFQIGGYQDIAAVKQTATQPSTPTAFGYGGEGVPMGMGWIYVHRHHLGYIGTNVVDDAGSTMHGGGSYALDGVTLHGGGPNHNTVIEARSDLVVYDTVSPSCTNSNTVAHQVRAFITVDGTTAASDMCMFGLASFVAGGPNANNFNLGNETDVGTANNAANFTRCGWNLNSIGSAKGGASDHSQPWYDAGLLLTSGPQFESTQVHGKAGWLCGLAFSSHYGDETPGICEPISSDGYMIGAFGAWACKSVIYASEITTSGPAIDLPISTDGTGGVRFGLDVSIYRDQAGGLRLPATVGFGKASVAPSGIHSPGSGTDAISIAVNELRNCLINNGLAIAA